MTANSVGAVPSPCSTAGALPRSRRCTWSAAPKPGSRLSATPRSPSRTAIGSFLRSRTWSRSLERTAWYRFEMEARALRDLEGDMDPFPEGIYGVDPAKAALKTACTSS